ncbi:unnamed protein product [Didymodactylos carnosus]|uniref:Reverse transcriptase domain-containing protein n=1 Tax=Didymodactylos carnosus TaxID=1234261 RepID=A0A815W8Y0_9BILA|nr:unnamed protein product [Didymodactylos carnosus]CAF4399122.1 unnamed protein product [Didymodactylos carnosus]
MIDTGATNTLITEKALLSTHHKEFTSKYPWKLYQADGQTPLEVVGVVQLQIQIKSTNTNISAYVVKHLCTPCLLGTKYINKYKFKIDAGAQTITIINNKDEITTNIIKHSHSIRLPVRLINPVIVPPYENRNVLVSTDISTATTIFQPSFKLIQRTPILLSNNFLNVRNYRTYILIQNPSSFPQYLSKNLFVGTIQLPQFSDTLCASSSMERNNDPNSVAETNIHNLLIHLTDESQKHELKETFDRYRNIFDTLTPDVANSTICHAINTINHPPPSSKPYPLSYKKKEALFNIVQSLIQSGHLRESHSSYSEPAILVDKKDNTYRLVIDYKKLNSITIKDEFPLPNMEETLQEVGSGYNYFSKLDLKSGFQQLPIDEKDRHKTAFRTPFGLYEWNVLAQGLKNAPPTFQRVLSKLLEDCRQFCLVYLDDIIIFSKSFEEHRIHLDQVLSRLHRANFQLNPLKCAIAIDYLGHRVTHTGISPLPEKIASILLLKERKTLKEANKFLGALSWYRKFIPRFATTAAPVHAVTNLPKNLRYKFKWSIEQSDAFHELKKLLTEAPLFLHFPIDNNHVILSTDAAKNGISSVLHQDVDGQIHNLYYHSQLISNIQQRYDTGAKEALAIALSFKRMHQF